MRLRIIALISLAFGLSACSDDGLRQLYPQGEGPDEFIIVPNKPLEQPTNLAALPDPTPGGANRTDAQPLADGAAALGGRLPPIDGTVPNADGAMVNHASRFGVDANIRPELAKADAEFRRRKARFTQIRIVRQDIYNRVYADEALDAQDVANAYRRAGVPTPTAPPLN